MATEVRQSVTQNKNPLVITDGFKMVFRRAPNVIYFLQNFTLPGITVGEVTIGRSQQNVYVPGDRIVYEQFIASMLVAEDMDNWKEVHDWLQRSVKSDNSADKYDDITVFVLTSKGNVNKTISFKNAFPTSIGGVVFNTAEADATFGMVDVTFRYDYYTFESIS